MGSGFFRDVVALAALQGLLVVLPRRDALGALSARRGAAWAALPAVAILTGTFMPAFVPGTATATMWLAMASAPVLGIVAIARVCRGPRVLVGSAAVASAALCAATRGWLGDIATSALTALAALTIGVIIARLIPPRWLAVAMLSVCALDAALIETGLSQPGLMAMQQATLHFHAPLFDRAAVGPVAIGYPDLVLASLVGGLVSADLGTQAAAGGLMALLAAGYELLLPAAGGLLPATVPIGATAAAVWLWRRQGHWRRLVQRRHIAERIPVGVATSAAPVTASAVAEASPC